MYTLQACSVLRWFIALAGMMALFCPDGNAQPSICYVGQVSSGCPVTGTPTAQSFIAGDTSSYATMQAQMAPLPQPVIPVYGVIPPATTNYQNADTPGCQTTSSCIFSTAGATSASIGLNAYTLNAIGNAASAGKGVYGIWWEANPLLFTSASNYAGSCVAGQPAQNAYVLGQSIIWLKYVTVTLGLHLRISVTPLPNTFTACGYTAGAVTAAQFNLAVNPMIAAIPGYLNLQGVDVTKLDLILIAREPNGYTQVATGNANPYTAAQFTVIGVSGCAALHAASGGSGIRCGMGFTAGDASPTNYIANYIAGATADTTAWGFETYAGKTSSGYASLMAGLLSNCPAAKLAGMTCENTEGNPPTYVQSSAPSGGEANATPGWGCAAPNLTLYGVTNAWNLLMPRWNASQGASSSVWFGTQGATVTDPRLSANCFVSDSTGSTYYAMTHSTGSTVVAAGFQAGAAFGNVSFQGTLTLSGKIQIQ